MPSEDIHGTIRHWRFTPTDEYLENPHKGCCTFQRFNGDPLNLYNTWSEEGPLDGLLQKEDRFNDIPGVVFPKTTEGYLPSTVAYCRWFWRVFEPEQGVYDFSVIEKALEACVEKDQTLAVAVMPFGYVASGQPKLPDWYDDRYPKVPYKDWVDRVPDYNSQEYLALWGGFIKKFGEIYDGHPLIETFDVSFVGPWGEGDGYCHDAQMQKMIDVYRSAFTQTPLLSMIGKLPNNGDMMAIGTQKGLGWRANSFGDLKTTAAHKAPQHMKWNHMYNLYPMRVCETGSQEAWKKAPVCMEVSYVVSDWYRAGYDIDFILEQGLKYHTTYFMPKSSAIPDVWREKLEAFCRKLGYRFVFRQASISSKVKPGGTFDFRAWIENVGIAPLYRKYDFAIRLTQGEEHHVMVCDDIDVTTWLPGDICFHKHVTLPPQFKPGYVEICAGLVEPKTQDARVNFAIKQRYTDRWAVMGGIEVRA